MSVSWLLFRKSVTRSWKRLALTSAAIAVGILVLLALVSGINALNNRHARLNWGSQIQDAASNPQQQVPGASPLIASTSPPNGNDNLNLWQDKPIRAISLYATGDNSPQFPGFTTPKPGEYLLSPGLKKIVDSNSDIDLATRFGSKYVGETPKEYTTSPDMLLAVSGVSMSDQQIEASVQNHEVARMYEVTAKRKADFMFSGVLLATVMLGASILLFPVIIFLSVATQLGSAQREQRYAALRLIGATRSQITRIIALESFMASLVGVAFGVLAFFMIRDWLPNFKFNGEGFWPSDFIIMTWQYAITIGLTLGLSLLANWWGMRHVRTSPLGVSRRQTITKRPSFWRSIPLLLGLVIILFARFTSTKDAAGQSAIFAVMAGVMLVMFGLVIAGPYLTERLARLIARFTSSPETLLSSKRIAVQSGRVFRSVSGVVIALFAAGFYLTAVSGIANYEASTVANNGLSRLERNTVLMTRVTSDTLLDTLSRQPYVSSVVKAPELMGAYTVIPCSEITHYTTFTCQAEPNSYLSAVYFPSSDIDSTRVYGKDLADLKRNLQAAVPSGEMTTSSAYLLKLTDIQHLDNLRTLILSSADYPGATIDSGLYAQEPAAEPVVKELAGLTYLGLVVVLCIAVISLIVATIGGILERQRSLATLRLGGMTAAQMKRVVFTESLIPLLSASVVAAGLGVAVGYLFMQMVSATLDAVISGQLLAVLAASIGLAALGVYLVLPMLDKITRPEANQTE